MKNIYLQNRYLSLCTTEYFSCPQKQICIKYLEKKKFESFFQWIVSGRLGDNGPHVLGHVVKEFSLEKGVFQHLPKMVAWNARAATPQEEHVINQVVQVQ